MLNVTTVITHSVYVLNIGNLKYASPFRQNKNGGGGVEVDDDQPE